MDTSADPVVGTAKLPNAITAAIIKAGNTLILRISTSPFLNRLCQTCFLSAGSSGDWLMKYWMPALRLDSLHLYLLPDKKVTTTMPRKHFKLYRDNTLILRDKFESVTLQVKRNPSMAATACNKTVKCGGY